MPKGSAERSIGELGELGFLEQLLPTLRGGRGVTVGAGDDCAVVVAAARHLLLTTDALVENVHFRRAWMTARQIGRKAYLVNASDIAAMGGQPRYCLVSLGVPPDFPGRQLLALQRGIATAAAETGARVVGGNLARTERLFVSIALVGAAPARSVRRAGARPGDSLYVTGSLGEAALGLRMLEDNHRARGAAVRSFREPVPRLRAGSLLARRGLASAMIDVSDGLLRDLGHLCAASCVGAQIEVERLPISPRVRRHGWAFALGGGEDYELLCAVPPRQERRLAGLRGGLGCRLTRIGSCTEKRGIEAVDADGRQVSVGRLGFDHFAGGEAA